LLAGRRWSPAQPLCRCLATSGITVAEAASSTTQQTNANRAVAAYNAMQQYFYVNNGTSLYLESYPWTGGNKYCFLWPFTRALVGTLALAGVPSSLVGGTSYTSAVQDRFTGVGQYWDGAANPPAYDSYVISQGGGDKYHDDNAWVSLAFIEQYRMGLPVASSEPVPLNRAEQLFTATQERTGVPFRLHAYDISAEQSVQDRVAPTLRNQL